MSKYEILSLGLETAVVIILLIEFWYDKWYNDQERRHKRREKIIKPKIVYEKDMD